jgi:hypothetical protein
VTHQTTYHIRKSKPQSCRCSFGWDHGSSLFMLHLNLNLNVTVDRPNANSRQQHADLHSCWNRNSQPESGFQIDPYLTASSPLRDHRARKQLPLRLESTSTSRIRFQAQIYRYTTATPGEPRIFKRGVQISPLGTGQRPPPRRGIYVPP